MKEERRLVWRVLRNWTEIAHGGRFPRCEEIDRWMRGADVSNGKQSGPRIGIEKGPRTSPWEQPDPLGERPRLPICGGVAPRCNFG
jgi:hypothetical protein